MAEHGRRSTYVHGCRCEECRAANRAYVREHRARDPERTKAERKERYEERREIENAQGRAWHAANRDRRNAQKRDAYRGKQTAS